MPLTGPMVEIPTAKPQRVRPKVQPQPITVPEPQHIAKLFAPRPLPPAPASADMPNTRSPSVIFAALPLGGRLKFDPWNNQLELLKAKPVGTVAEREKMPFEITPFILYLTRDKISPAETATIPADPVTDNRAPAGDPVDTAKKTQ